jgi:hypothetical protein
MTLAEYERQERNWACEFRPYTLQHPTAYGFQIDVSLSMFAEYWLVTKCISETVLNS